MPRFATALDLSQVAPPAVIDRLDYEAIRSGLIADFKARALLLAAAKGSDLDHLGFYYGVARLLIAPASGNVPARRTAKQAICRPCRGAER